MDFNGSDNLMLTTGGVSIQTNVGPYKRVVVAVLKVRNTRVTSQLRVKYTWEEMDPQAPPSNMAKQEELGPGIFLHTTRTSSPDSFLYSVSYNKSGKQLKFTINFSGSQNLYFDSGSLSKTVRVNAFDKVRLGTLRPIVPSNSWTLKTKYTWSEEETPAGILERRLQPKYTPPSPMYNAAATLSTTTPASIPAAPAAQRRPSFRAPPPPTRPTTSATTTDTKRQAIADKIDLTTTRVDDGNMSTFTFEIDNMKYKDLKVTLDFYGSSNLMLDTGSLKSTVRVSPYERRIVGVLHTMVSGQGWNLKQKVSVEQLEPAPSSSFSANRTTMSARDKIMAASKNTAFYRRASLDRGVAAPGAIGPPPGVQTSSNKSPPSPPVLCMLESIGLKHYWPLFLSEAMDDMSMLMSMAQDKIVFRDALREMGIARMGHREAILNAINV